MTDTVHCDPSIETQKPSPRKGKTKKFSFLAPHARMIENVPRTAREAAIKNATPLWDKDQVVSVAPVQEILQNKNLCLQERAILTSMMTCAPAFIHHLGTIRALLDDCAEKTARKYLTSLHEKGYISRTMVTREGKRSYYRYELKTLFLTPNGNDSPLNKIQGSITPNLPASREESTAAPGLNISMTLEESQSKAIANAAMQPAGDLKNTLNEVKLDSRKVQGWKKRQKDSVLFEETEKKARKFKSPARKAPKATSDRNWRSGKCSQAKAWLWIQEHPEGKALADRLISMTNQDEWTSPLARMLFRRWRGGEIKLKHVIRLEQVMDKKYTEIGLRWLLENVEDILHRNQRHFEEANQMLSFQVDTFLNGDDIKKGCELDTARSFLRRLALEDELTYDNVFVKSPTCVARYALIYQLVDMGREDLVMQYHASYSSDVEAEMAKNLSVWKLYNSMHLADKELFFYDNFSATMLRDQTKKMLQQECALIGTELQTVLNFLDRTTLKK